MLTELSASVPVLPLSMHIYRICVSMAKHLEKYMLIRYIKHTSSLVTVDKSLASLGISL